MMLTKFLGRVISGKILFGSHQKVFADPWLNGLNINEAWSAKRTPLDFINLLRMLAQHY